MTKSSKQQRKTKTAVGYHGPLRVSPSPKERRIIQEGHFTINASTTASGTIDYQFLSSQFGFAGGPTYLVEIPSLVLYNSYQLRVRAVTLKYVPYFNATYVAAASSGTGCGLAVCLPTLSGVTGNSLDNLLGYAGVKTVRACSPYMLKWRASSVADDNQWIGPNNNHIMTNQTYSYTGWSMIGFMAGCNASIQTGQYFFTFIIEVELPN